MAAPASTAKRAWDSGIRVNDLTGDSTNRAESPVWRRAGWNTRFHHSASARQTRAEPQATGEPGPTTDLPTSYSGPVYERAHTTVFTHSRKFQHLSNVTLRAPYRPGLHGFPEAEANFRGFCGELDDQLLCLNNTLSSVQARLAQKLQVAKGEPATCQSATNLRALVNENTAAQMQVYNAAIASWSADAAYP